MRWKQRSPGQTFEDAAGSTDRRGHEPRNAGVSGSDKGRGQSLLQRLQKECRPTDIRLSAGGGGGGRSALRSCKVTAMLL